MDIFWGIMVGVSCIKAKKARVPRNVLEAREN